MIGAAAALASNPVLLPIGIVTGRRKRSETFPEEERTDFQMDYILYMLKENLAKVRIERRRNLARLLIPFFFFYEQIQRDGSSDRLIVSPRCVARLTCEIQKDYLSDLGKDVEILSANRKYHLTNLYVKFRSIWIFRDTSRIKVISINLENFLQDTEQRAEYQYREHGREGPDQAGRRRGVIGERKLRHIRL